MKKLIKILIVLMVLSMGCEKLVDFEEKPDAKERRTTFNIQIIDSTGIMENVYGKSYASDASVLIKSNLMKTEYDKVSNDKGMVNIENAISDKYIVSVSRPVTPEEMEKAFGEKKYQRKLVNSSMGTVELRADQTDTVKVYLDKLIVESPLVISEIYSVGPPDAGLYFHDKYVEVFNQSNETVYLDKIIIATVYSVSYSGLSYVDDPDYVHSSNIWKFPGDGDDYPIEPGEFVVCAEDAIDHTVNAPKSIDLSDVSFEFYKSDAPDLDNKNVPNMKKIYQSSGFDWLIGGEQGAIVLSTAHKDSLKWYDDHYIIPNETVLDGVEYLDDVTRLEEKILYPGIDAGAAGGLEFYTGKTLERIPVFKDGRYQMKDDNNSSLDFNIYSKPSPEYHNEIE
jgi:hypothetical protein